MLGRKLAQCLELDHNPPKADEVRCVVLLETHALVLKRQLGRGDEWDPPRGEFESQTLLLHGLQKAGADHAVHLEHGALDAEDLVRMHQPFVWFVWFADHSWLSLVRPKPWNNTRTNLRDRLAEHQRAGVAHGGRAEGEDGVVVVL